MAAFRQASATAEWVDEIDFVGPRIRAGRAAWLLLLAGVLSVLAVLPPAQEAEASWQEAQAAVRRLERAQHQQALRDKGLRGGGREGRTGLTAQGQAGAARVASQLAYPWLDTLARVESAAQSQQAVLLSFGLDLGSQGSQGSGKSLPEVRLSAAVMSDAQALAWAQAHGAQEQAPTQPQTQALLTRRERLSSPITSSAGSHPWRADASWKGLAP